MFTVVLTFTPKSLAGNVNSILIDLSRTPWWRRGTINVGTSVKNCQVDLEGKDARSCLVRGFLNNKAGFIWIKQNYFYCFVVSGFSWDTNLRAISRGRWSMISRNTFLESSMPPLTWPKWVFWGLFSDISSLNRVLFNYRV